MPSNRASKTFVREEVLRAVDESRKEVFTALDNLRKDFERSQAENKDSLEDFRETVAAVQKKISETVETLNYQTTKLSVLIEGSLRSAIRLDRGEAWAVSVRIASASSLIVHIADLMERTGVWITRARDQIIDMLKETQAVKRVVELVQRKFANADEEEWEPLRSSVLRYPLIDSSSGEVQPQNLARLIHPAPPYLQKVLIQLVKMFDPRPVDGTINVDDYDDFMKTEASLICLVMLSDGAFEVCAEIPPHQLHFNCRGSIALQHPAAIVEGGEIKSSSSFFAEAEVQLYRRFKLLTFVLPRIDSDITHVLADGWTYVAYTRHDYKKPSRKATDLEEEGILRFKFHRYIVQDL